jgi:methyl-accepting chemotaxis protein
MKLLPNLNVRAKLIGTFVLITIGALVGAAVGSLSTYRMHQNAEYLYEKALIPTNAIVDVMRNIHDARAQLLLSLQHDPRGKWVKQHDHSIDKHLDAYQDAYDDAKSALGSYVRQPGLGEEEVAMLAQLSAGLEQLRQAGAHAVDRFHGDDFDGANEAILTELNPALTELDKRVRAVEDMLIQRSQQQNKDNGDLVRRISMFLWVTTGFGVAFIWGMYVYLSRHITKPLRRVSDIVGKVAQGDLSSRIEARGRSEFDEVLRSVGVMQARLREIMGEIDQASRVAADNAQLLAHQIDETAKRSQQQQDRVLETSSALEQMSRSIHEVSNGAEGVSRASAEAKDLAADGSASMRHNLATIEKIVEQVRNSNLSIVALSDSTQHIAELAKTIREIADQTNLLALNAAIEAARAGEQGRGFAVVATEIRKLAERAADSSGKIGALLDGVSVSSDNAIAAMKQTLVDVEAGASQTRALDDTLSRILGASNDVSALTASIAAATRQQSVGSQQTAQSMDQISQLAEDNNAGIQQLAVAAEEMAAVASRLTGLVGRFRFG